MGNRNQTRRSALPWVAAIAAIVVPAAGLGYLVTTFLFAFSGGQYRMVTVVNLGVIIVAGLGALVAAVTWRLRSPSVATVATLIVTGAGWVVALIAEWIISFSLGAT